MIFEFLIMEAIPENFSGFNHYYSRQTMLKCLKSQRTILRFTTLYRALLVHKDFNGILDSN